MNEEDLKPHIWKEKGEYFCAIPYNFFGLDWKQYGLIGRGPTPAEAYADYKWWCRCSDLVATIY